MASIRRTKKEIKKHPAGVLWLGHAKHWVADSVNPSNEYRGISRFFLSVDINELGKLTRLSNKCIKRFIVKNL